MNLPLKMSRLPVSHLFAETNRETIRKFLKCENRNIFIAMFEIIDLDIMVNLLISTGHGKTMLLNSVHFMRFSSKT